MGAEIIASAQGAALVSMLEMVGLLGTEFPEEIWLEVGAGTCSPQVGEAAKVVMGLIKLSGGDVVIGLL